MFRVVVLLDGDLDLRSQACSWFAPYLAPSDFPSALNQPRGRMQENVTAVDFQLETCPHSMKYRQWFEAKIKTKRT
ncbi:hypothetical protein CHARACLAT_030071 [Characodon lateralis]|uniref:Uncharacterized protein n=1 Tax=Characodon lateralis TaxID=208331 RepID=A0ABU7DL44_9TELE|nr:hypothetical protein [Characodon lateralis]